MNYSGTLLLTSTGFSSQKVFGVFKEMVSTQNLKKAVIITTASDGKERNQYSQMAFSQLELAGLETVDFYDFENDGPRDISSYEVIYVCGGNTFKLMKFARDMNFVESIKSLLKKGGVYVGVSAGSLIVGPSIQIAGEIEPDENIVGLTDLRGFRIVNITIFPHYSPKVEGKIELFEERNNAEVGRIDNSQAILIRDGEKILI